MKECDKATGEGCSDEFKRLLKEDKPLESPLVDPVAIGTGFLTGFFRSTLAKLGFGAAEGAAASASSAAAAELLMPGGSPIGVAGSRGVQVVTGSVDDAAALFGKLSQGATKVEGSSYPGTLMRLPDGGTVGMRTVMSRSPNSAATIDVRNVTGVPNMKIKFNP